MGEPFSSAVEGVIVQAEGLMLGVGANSEGELGQLCRSIAH